MNIKMTDGLAAVILSAALPVSAFATTTYDPVAQFNNSGFGTD